MIGVDQTLDPKGSYWIWPGILNGIEKRTGQTPHPEKQYLSMSQKLLKGCEGPSKLKSPDAPSQSQRSAPSSRISSQHLACYPPPPFSPISQFKSPPPTVPRHLGLLGSKSGCSCSSQKDVEKDTGNRQVCCRLYVNCD